MRVAQPAPNQAPIRLPASRLTMIGQCAATLANGTADARKGSAEATTTRLIALLRITACSAANRNAPISSGNRNSAPPSPINPPSAPITAPPPKAAGLLRRAPRAEVSPVMVSPVMPARPLATAPVLSKLLPRCAVAARRDRTPRRDRNADHLDHLCTHRDLDAASRQTAQQAADWGAQSERPNRRDDTTFLDPITDARAGYEAASFRR